MDGAPAKVNWVVLVGQIFHNRTGRQGRNKMSENMKKFPFYLRKLDFYVGEMEA